METSTKVDFKALVPWRTNRPEALATREDFFDPFEVGNGKSTPSTTRAS
jgi:hypothetical protein